MGNDLNIEGGDIGELRGFGFLVLRVLGMLINRFVN